MTGQGGKGPPAPVAQGNLSDTPIAHVVMSLLRRKFDGTLVVWPEAGTKGQDRLRLQSGSPTAGRFRHVAPTLEAGVLQLLTRRRGTFALYALDLVGTGSGVVEGRVDPIELVADALRQQADEAVMDAFLARLEGKVRLSPKASLARLKLRPAEAGFVDLLRAGPDTIAALVAGWSDKRAAKRVLYMLALTRWVEPYEKADGAARGGDRQDRHAAAPAASSGPLSAPPSVPAAGSRRPSRRSKASHPSDPEPPPPVPAGLSSAHQALWREMADRAAAVDGQNYFEMLGIEESAGAKKVRDAYFALVKKCHPDRLPRELAELKPWVDRAFHHYTEAHGQLTDEEKRKAYLQLMRDGGGTPASERKLAAILQAAMDFQKVEVLIRRKQWEQADEMLREIMEVDPDQPDYHAALGLVLFQRNQDAPPFALIHEHLDRAIAASERHERAQLTKGQVLKREGKDGQALQHFQRVVELNPQNLVAAREVRLANSRQRRSNRPKGDDGGFFGKLFKKK